MIAKLLTVSDILIGRIFHSRSNPNLFALKSRNFFQQYCCSKYDETLKNEYKWRTHFQNHAPRPKINPFETFHPFSYPLEDPNCQMWKDLERTRSISFRLLLQGKERDLDSGGGGERSAVGISYEKRHAGYTGADKMNDNGVEFWGNDKTRWI